LLGVVVGAVTRELAEALNLDRSAGALVNDVSEGSSADRAGIEPGDVILEFDGQTVETWGDLPPMVGANPPGTEVEVLVSRAGKKQSFDVTLDALESDQLAGGSDAVDDARQSNALGIAVESLTSEQRRALEGLEGGVLITDVESDAAYRAGLRHGDVVLMINNHEIEGVDDFDSVVESLPEEKAVALRVFREGVTNFIAYTPTAD
jgi:serine protease Do